MHLTSIVVLGATGSRLAMIHFSNFLRLFVFFLVPFIACGDWFAYEGPCEDVNCADNNPCTADSCTAGCSSQTTCHHDPVANGTACSLRGVSGVCMNGICDLCSGVVCHDDGNECTSDICDRSTGRCGVPADDGTICEYKGLFWGSCASGFCAKALCDDGVCGDGNECTDDACNPIARLCSYIPVEDGALCDLGASSGFCRSGTCQPEPECEFPEDCEDENECTQDLCVDGWCAFDPLGDGMPCGDGAGVCDAGICQFEF